MKPVMILSTLLLATTLTGCETIQKYKATQNPGIILSTRCEAHAINFCGKKRNQTFTADDWKRCRKLPVLPRKALVNLPTETLAGLRGYQKSVQRCPR